MLQHYIFLFSLSCLQVPVGNYLVEENDDKLVLKPAELVDLIIEERSRTLVPTESSKVPDNVGTVTNMDDDKQPIEAETEECTDDEMLRKRKVWSRWSKWGACSASCGEGVMTRRRACVAGRCARGELEVQRRVCRRAPCRADDDVD